MLGNLGEQTGEAMRRMNLPPNHDAAIENELVELSERLDELVAVYRRAAEPAAAIKAA